MTDAQIRAAEFIKPIESRIKAVLPESTPAQTYVATVIEYLIRHPDLYQCQQSSLEDAIMDAAMLGLELGAPFDLAAIIPFKDNRAGILKARLIIEYRGRMMQAYGTGKVKAIEGRAVYQEDDFKFSYGRTPVLTHQPCIFENRGPIVYAYAIAQLTDGGTASEVITRHDADRARADSPGANKPDSLWKRREAEMWIKTAIKKLVNRLPRAPAPMQSQSGPPPPTAKEYSKLINAILVSPEHYKDALKKLAVKFPSDTGTIDSVLAMMRQLYRNDASKDQAAT